MKLKRRIKRALIKLRNPNRPWYKMILTRTQRRELKRARMIGFGNLWRIWRRGKNKHVLVDSKVLAYTEDLTNLRFNKSMLDLRESSEEMYMSGLQIDITEANFLKFLVYSVGAFKILEVGTFRGWSTAVLAEALVETELENGPLFSARAKAHQNREGGESSNATQITTIELRDEEAEDAQMLWETHLNPIVKSRIKMVRGDASKVMQTLIKKEYFDLIFIDADKAQYGHYLSIAKQLIEPGGLIVLDNMLNAGLVATTSKDRPSMALRQLNTEIFNSADISFEPFLIPAWDGVVVLRRKFN